MIPLWPPNYIKYLRDDNTSVMIFHIFNVRYMHLCYIYCINWPHLIRSHLSALTPRYKSWNCL